MMPSGFWVVRIMAYPFGSGGKITVGNGALKMETPPKAVLRLGGRPNVCCAFDCAGSGLRTMPTPVPSLVLLMRPKYPRPSELCQASQEI